MNRREAILGLGSVAAVPLAAEEAPKQRYSGATRIYTEWWLNNESPVESIRLTVTMKDGDVKFWHPLDFAKASRLFAEEEDKTYARSPRAFGPYPNEIDFGK